MSCESALLRFHGSLLQLRGAAASSSPLVDASGNVLLFNGQIFPPCFLDVPPGASDAQLLLAALGAPGADVPAVLTGLRGPWSLAYWHSATRTLWFGRDPIGAWPLHLQLALMLLCCTLAWPTFALAPACTTAVVMKAGDERAWQGLRHRSALGATETRATPPPPVQVAAACWCIRQARPMAASC